MTPKICFTFPEDSLTYQVESINREEAEVNLVSINGPIPVRRSVGARELLLTLSNELPKVANPLMQELDQLLMVKDFGQDVTEHPMYPKVLQLFFTSFGNERSADL